ncbi:MAG: hypothetical protein LiPW39_56 [Parcubacteria group bacterium LiPW_39]|nr:MAG: hypothetical protein LiPW39_56 [Parcubacteria group bacterium LiPW_39]
MGELFKCNRIISEKGAYAVAVFVESPEGIPLVKDPKKPHPWWKFAGGRSEAGENAKGAVIREAYEELGFTLEDKNVKQIYTENRENHVFVLFKTTLDSLAGLREKGIDGEEIKVFSLEQIKQMPDFMPNHHRIIKQLGII